MDLSIVFVSSSIAVACICLKWEGQIIFQCINTVCLSDSKLDPFISSLACTLFSPYLPLLYLDVLLFYIYLV